MVHSGTQPTTQPEWYTQPREEAGGRWTVIHFLPTWEICSKLNNSGCGFGRRSSKTVNIVKRIFPLKSSKFCPRRWLDIIDWVPRNVQQHIVTKSLENEKNGSENSKQLCGENVGNICAGYSGRGSGLSVLVVSLSQPAMLIHPRGLGNSTNDTSTSAYQ